MERTIKQYFLLAFKGIGMGAADVVPGVSGGTIAFITGIYEELINSIKSVNTDALKTLFRKGIANFWARINGNFLFAVAAGILISLFSLAKGIKYLLDTHPIMVWSFFFGLILASAFHVARKIERWHWSHILSLVIGAVLAYFITSITPAETPQAYWFLFLSGALAICAMILPGISGSFILLLLGKYAFVLDAVSGFKLDILAIVGIGAIVGLIAFANVLGWLLNRFYNLTIALLAGFMVGSLNKVWPWKHTVETMINSHGETVPKIQENIMPAAFERLTGMVPHTGAAVGFFAAGVILIVLIEVFSGKKAVAEK